MYMVYSLLSLLVSCVIVLFFTANSLQDSGIFGSVYG